MIAVTLELVIFMYLIEQINMNINRKEPKDEYYFELNSDQIALIQENELSHGEITNALDILERLDFTKEQYNDKDYLRNQIDNII